MLKQTMEQPLTIELMKRLSKWPSLQDSIMKNSLAVIESTADQSNPEDVNEHDSSEMDEENPALEGHFLTERAVLDVTVVDSCVCKCHGDQTMVFKLTLPFSCSKCSQQFCCKCQFLVHREFHRGERKYECQICGKTYFYKSDLVRHLPVHSQVKPHVCKVCGRSFNQVGHLITHRLVHTGEKPFTCDVCHKPFNRKSNLQKHKMIHTGERPFECGICSSRFSRKGDLQRHMMLHTGERPYKCGICEKSFSQKPHLVSHTAVHTGERPYKCLACGRSFNRRNHLLKHQVEKCPELAGSTDLAPLTANSFLTNHNHLLASKDSDKSGESIVEKSYFNGVGLDLKFKKVNELPNLRSPSERVEEIVEMSLLRARLSESCARSFTGEKNLTDSTRILKLTESRNVKSRVCERVSEGLLSRVLLSSLTSETHNNTVTENSAYNEVTKGNKDAEETSNAQDKI